MNWTIFNFLCLSKNQPKELLTILHSENLVEEQMFYLMLYYVNRSGTKIIEKELCFLIRKNGELKKNLAAIYSFRKNK